MWSSIPNTVQSFIHEENVPIKVSHADGSPELFPNQPAIVAAVAQRDGKTLFVKSAKEGRKWELPGGRIGSDESPSDAIKREFTEETGYRADKVSPLVVLLWTFPDRTLTQVVFNVTPGEKISKPTEEIGDIEWRENVPEEITYGESGRETHELLISENDTEKFSESIKFVEQALDTASDKRRQVAAGFVASSVIAGLARKAYSEYQSRTIEKDDD